MSPSEALRLVAQTIATLVEGIGVAIVAVAVGLATLRYLASLAAIAAIRTALNFFLQREIAADARMATANATLERTAAAGRAGPVLEVQPDAPAAGGNRSHGQHREEVVKLAQPKPEANHNRWREERYG